MESINDIYIYAQKNKSLMSLTIELLTKCNWNCYHCYLPEHSNSGLSTEEVISILKQAKAFGVFDITFTGGEIFLRKDIFSLIKEARKLGFCVYLYTNISLLDENKIRELKYLYISSISCSIFSLNQDIHDSITKTSNSLKVALENLRLLKKANIPTSISTPLLKENYESYKELYAYCSQNNFGFKPDKDIFGKLDGNKDPYKYSLSQNQLKEIIQEIDYINNYEKKKRVFDEIVCKPFSTSLFIDSFGNIYPCNRLRVKLGNIASDKLNDIWIKSSKLKFLQNITWGDLSECYSCEMNQYCVRCPEDALDDSGDILSKANQSCKIAIIRKEVYSKEIQSFSEKV